MAKTTGNSYLVSNQVWEDEKFEQLSLTGQKIWFYLLTGRCRTRLPGLVATNAPIIAQRIAGHSGRSHTAEEVQTELTELIRLGMIEFDGKVIRLVNAGRYADCPNPNILRSWWRIWCDLPRSRLKQSHLPSLWECLEGSDAKIRAAWKETFGPEFERFLDGGASTTGNSEPPPKPKGLPKALPKGLPKALPPTPSVGDNSQNDEAPGTQWTGIDD